jgi:hypothetical protein
MEDMPAKSQIHSTPFAAIVIVKIMQARGKHPERLL